MTIWVEIRSGLKRTGKIRLVPLETVYNYTGFRTCFGFNDEQAEEIRANNSTADLRGQGVYCDELFCDFDRQYPTAFRDMLASSGIRATEWHSGGRSAHFHIAVNPVFDVSVPARCKAWMRQHTDEADLSFLHQGGVYRLPGTYHAKYPGKRKVLVAEYPGQPLTLAPVPVPSYDGGTGDPGDFWSLLTTGRPPGQRTGFVWLLAKLAAEGGVSLAEATKEILAWNMHMAGSPLPVLAVTDQIDKAYRRTAHG